MNRKNLLIVMLLTTGFLVNTTLMAAQTESPVVCTSSQTLNLVYGDHATGCEINPATDLDTFIFDGTAGDEIRIIVLSETPGFDPRIELRDPFGAVLHDINCNGNNVFGDPIICSLSINETLLLSGSYFIAISDLGSNDAGNYTIQLERILPVISPLDLLYNIAIDDDGIAPATDMDFLVFQGAEVSGVRITVLSKTGGLDPRLEVRDPDGTVISDMSCSGNNVFGDPIICSFIVDLSLSLTGTYVLALSDSGSNEIGDYQIGLQCLFGPCPGNAITRPECDIQLNQTSFIDGETVTADVFSFRNQTSEAIALETKIWLGVPGIPPVEIINLGADGSFVLPAGTSVDLGPLPILPVAAGLPRGDYELSCRFLNPTTGRLLMEDRNFFDLQ